MKLTPLNKILQNTAQEDFEFDAMNIVETVTEFNEAVVEFNKIVESYTTVTEIKDAINGREIGDAFAAYVGDALTPIAPAFTKKNSVDTVEQLEAALESVDIKIISVIKTVFRKLGEMLRRITATIKKSFSDSQRRALIKHLDNILAKPGAIHYSSDKYPDKYPLAVISTVDSNGKFSGDVEGTLAAMHTDFDIYFKVRECLISNKAEDINEINIDKVANLQFIEFQKMHREQDLRVILSFIRDIISDAAIPGLIAKAHEKLVTPKQIDRITGSFDTKILETVEGVIYTVGNISILYLRLIMRTSNIVKYMLTNHITFEFKV